MTLEIREGNEEGRQEEEQMRQEKTRDTVIYEKSNRNLKQNYKCKREKQKEVNR